MSSLFTQINKISQEAQEQRAMADKQQPAENATPADSPAPSSTDTSASLLDHSNASNGTANQHNTVPNDAAPTSGTVVPQFGTTIENVESEKKAVRRASKTSKASRANERGEDLGKGSRLDLDKLRTIIEELSVMQANTNGLNMRMSGKEAADIEDFIHDALRKEGLKGYEVSAAKLMRYAMRYMFRVHPQEFITALRAALKVEETLSI